MFKTDKEKSKQVSHKKASPQSYWQNEVKNQRDKAGFDPSRCRAQGLYRIAQPSSLAMAAEKIRASTGIELEGVEAQIDERLQQEDKLAVAEAGKTIRFANQSLAKNNAIALHEMLHIAQQRGGSSAQTQSKLSQTQAEQELDSISEKVAHRLPVHIGRTRVPRLYRGLAKQQSKLETKTNAETKTEEAKGLPLGQGHCVVLYLDIGDVAFVNAAARHVKERPNRCYAWQNNKVKKNQAMPFKTGEDIVETLRHVAKEMGKISEVYILSHGYSRGILTLNSDGTEYSTEHGLSLGHRAKDPSLQNRTQNNPSSTENKPSSSANTGRSIGDIKAIAKDCFMPNVTFVIHACRSSEKPSVQGYKTREDKSFNELLYLALHEELGENTHVYGHQGTTKAGYNCPWHEHSKDAAKGGIKQHLPKDLLYGNYMHCRSNDLKNGEKAKLAKNPKINKRSV